MMVNGPLEIYGTVIGVKLFDAIFNILASTGIVFIPLLIMIFENITKPYESEIENGAATSLKRVSIHLFLWIFTVMLFVAPTWHLDVTEITYKPVCATQAVTSSFGDTGTTYDNAFENLDYSDLRIPVMMGFILSGMSGFTNAAITSLPCKTDVEKIQNTIDTTRLTPKLNAQVERFQNECFAPAKAQFDNQTPDKSTYKSLMKEYGGNTDLSWIGSHVFQTLYYGQIYPTKPVPGFPNGEYPSQYQSYNQEQGVDPSQWGYPDCETWWTDPEYGLQQKLVNLASKHDPQNSHLGNLPLTDEVSSWIARAKRFTHVGSQITADDVISHDMLYDPGNNSGFGRNYTGWMSDEDTPIGMENSSVQRDTAEVAANIGQAFDAAKSVAKREEISEEIPILQAILLSFGLAIGPMIIVVGMMTGRSISVIFTYYFLIGSLFFMTFIEKFIHYLELSLHASQNNGLYAMGDNLVMFNVFTQLYFYAPILYLMLMSIAGIGIGNSIGKAFSNSASGSANGIIGSAVGAITKSVF